MKTIKFYAAISALTFITLMLSAQEGDTTVDLLMKYKWVTEKDFSSEGIIELYSTFDLDKRRVVEVYDTNHPDYDPSDGPIWTKETEYYISNTKETIFRDSEVGKKVSGRYLIVKQKQHVGVYEIMLLNETKLILRYWNTDRHSTSSIWLAKPKL